MNSSIILFQCLSKDQDIIQIYNYDSFCYKAVKDIIHHNLEYSKAVCYTKEYY